MRTLYLLPLFVLGLAFPLLGAEPKIDPKSKLNYDQHVLPIMRMHCVGCHQGEKAKGGLDLSTFTALMAGGASGEAVKPGDAENSRLWRLTAHKEQPYMPPKGGPIPKDQIDVVFNWIQQGALENAGSKPLPVKPKADVSLLSVKRGKPDKIPMPEKPLPKNPVVVTAKPNAVIALAASPWAPLLAVGGQKQVILYHGETMELLGVLPFPHGMPHVLKFSRNGSLLLAGGGRGGLSGKVMVWDILTGEPILEVGNETDAVLAADISADQTQIALGGPNKMIRIYSTKDGSLIREIKKHTDWIYSIEFSPDAVLLATSDRSGGLMIWEAATGREFYNLRGHTAGITDLSWRDDSNVLASASEDGTVRLWEMENGNMIKNIAAHGGGVQAVKFGHDNRLVTTGRDKITKVWDANGNPQKNLLSHPDVPLRTIFAHDQSRVYAGDWTGVVQTISVTDGKLLAQATTNPQTPQQQLEAATKVMAEKQAAFEQANAAFNLANTKLQQASAEEAPARRLATDSANIAKQAADAVAPLKAKVDQATAAIPPLQSKLMAADVKAKALTEAYTKIKGAADANPANADLQANANAAKAEADKANTELAMIQKMVTDAQNALNQANAAYGPAQSNANETAAAAKLAADIHAPRAAVVKTAQEAVNAAKAILDKATAELNAAKTEVEKLKALVNPPPVPKKG